MKTTVIHHSADFDGLFCREIARKFLPDAELIGWDFADPPLPLSTCDTDRMYILDLPVDRPFGLRMEEMIDDPTSKGHRIGLCSDIIWIDHHKSSIESHPASIPGYRIDGVAACRLAWQWFQQWHGAELHLPDKQQFIDRKVSEPLAVCLAGEYDIWDKRDDRAETFQFGLRSRELSPADWSSLLCDEKITIDGIEARIAKGEVDIMAPDGSVTPSIVNSLLHDGSLLQKYQQRNDAGMMGKSFITEFEGLKFLALNTARFNSLTFAAKDVPETGHDALMGFVWNGKQWSVSLYHAKHRMDLDLSEIAKKHGGGGHRGACGFQAEHLPFVNHGKTP